MTRTPTNRHESNGPPPGNLGVWGGLSCIMTSVDTNNAEKKKLCVFLFFLSEKNFPEFFFQQFAESSDSRCKMSSNGHRHPVCLAKKWSWIWSDGPKVPKMRGNQKKCFY